MQTEILIFKDGPLSFAIALSEIKEIINLRRLLQLPFSARFVLGLAKLRSTVVPVVSPYLLQGGRGRYASSVDYACIVEAVKMEAAIACEKIIGVQTVQMPKRVTTEIASQVEVEGKRVRLLNLRHTVTLASDSLMDERFSVSL